MFLQAGYGYVEAPEFDLAAKPAGKGVGGVADAVEWVNPVPYVVVEGASGRTAIVTELFIPILVFGKAGQKEPVVGIDAAPPRREQSGSDLVELTGDAVLEIYHVLHDGEVVGDMQLRYVRPVGTILWRHSGVVDEMLQFKVI